MMPSKPCRKDYWMKRDKELSTGDMLALAIVIGAMIGLIARCVK